MVKQIQHFISGIWQIHPFHEGNTRTVTVFLIQYLREFGFDIDNTPFQQHSKYFRDALVLDNAKILQRRSEFLTAFLKISCSVVKMICLQKNVSRFRPRFS